MTYSEILGRRTWCVVTVAICSSLAAVGCGDTAQGTDGTLGTGGRGDPQGCAVRIHGGEPDLLAPPSFPHLTALPGTELDVELTVDADTRFVSITLKDFWATGLPSAETVTATTPGNERLALTVPTQRDLRGRYYADVILCAGDCTTAQAVYTLNPDNAEDPGNDPYHRFYNKNGAQVGSEETCLPVDSVALQ